MTEKIAAFTTLGRCPKPRTRREAGVRFAEPQKIDAILIFNRVDFLHARP